MLHLVEAYKQGKRPDQSLCEDGYVLTPHFAAVVDGSTSKVSGRAGGRMAMQAVCEALPLLPPDAGKGEMLTRLTACLARLNPPEAQAAAQYRLTCSAVIYSAARRVVWMVGDCQCRFGGRTYTNGKLIDHVLTRARQEALRYLLAHGHTADELRRNDLGRACIADALREQTNFQNCRQPRNPFVYTVFDGTPIDPAAVPELTVPDGVGECILSSDGYPVLADTLAESEAKLAELLAADPLCMGPNAGTKAWIEGNASFDDRCYLRFRL